MKHTSNIKTKFERMCPACDKSIYYSTQRGLKISIKSGKLCNGCARKGRKLTNSQRLLVSNKTKLAMSKPEIRERYLKENSKVMPIRVKKLRNWHKIPENKIKCITASKIAMTNMSEEQRALWKNNISKSKKGTFHSKQWKMDMSKKMSGKNNPFYGKHHSNENRRKFRLKMIDQLKECGIAFPQFNRKACEYFDFLNKWNGWHGVYALNGGEYFIKELGYWVDYYEPKHNIVVEWDEEQHHYGANEKMCEKDLIRQNEIIQLLHCDFYRIREKNLQIQKVEV